MHTTAPLHSAESNDSGPNDAELVTVRPAFVAHLEHAKMVQAKLGK